MLLEREGQTAYRDYKDNLHQRRWEIAAEPDQPDLARTRLQQDIFRPLIETDLQLRGKSFFTMGSCFAREVERALANFDQTVLSKVEPGSPIAFRKGGYTNRYNTAAMVNELEFALGIKDFNSASIVYADKEKSLFQDLHSHPAGGFCSRDVAVARRQATQELFAKVRDADVFICTLGLTEVWFDHETKEYLNVTPNAAALETYYPGRFEFRVLDYQDNMQNLARIHEIATTYLKPDLNIIVTVSPVPLLATFSGRDIVQANSYSKSTLRSCAESWQRTHPDQISYFPSYEMAMNSDRDVVWQQDLIHVTEPFVREIMRTFLVNYRCVDDPTQLDQTPSDRRDLQLARADSLEARGDLDGALKLLSAMEALGVKKREVELRKLRIHCARGETELAREYFSRMEGMVLRPRIMQAARSLMRLALDTEDPALAADVIVWLDQKNVTNWNLIHQMVLVARRDNTAASRVLPVIEQRYPEREFRISQLKQAVQAGAAQVSS